MTMSDALTEALKSELLCIADSNWVLGHWYTNCMLNGRELTDFTSMAGIAEDKLGHTRALFRFMEEYFDLPEYQLEFGRDVIQIHSMELLDVPPQNWTDFVLTIFLADAALWRFSNTLREGNFKPISNLVTKFGEESYFHQLCIDGWLKALDDQERAELTVALSRRLPQAMRWFEDRRSDALLSEGVRTQNLADAQNQFLNGVIDKLHSIFDISGEELRGYAAIDSTDEWDYRRRRTQESYMPPRLWESIVPTNEEALIARRPLAVSVDDNIDLFGRMKKDETEPKFR